VNLRETRRCNIERIDICAERFTPDMLMPDRLQVRFMGSTSLSPLQWRVLEAMSEAAPAGWLRLDLDVTEVGNIGVRNLFGRWPTEERLLEIPRPAVEALQELRHFMYEPGSGTWFTARFYLDPPMKPYVVYNFDDIPLEVEIPTEEWRRELERYPRDPKYILGWLQEKLK